MVPARKHGWLSLGEDTLSPLPLLLPELRLLDIHRQSQTWEVWTHYQITLKFLD